MWPLFMAFAWLLLTGEMVIMIIGYDYKIVLDFQKSQQRQNYKKITWMMNMGPQCGHLKFAPSFGFRVCSNLLAWEGAYCIVRLVEFLWLHCVFSNVSSNGRLERMHSHIGCIFFYFSPLCIFKCILRPLASADAVTLVAFFRLFSTVRF